MMYSSCFGALASQTWRSVPRRCRYALEVTSIFLYVRCHGLEGGAAHDYTAHELRNWAEFLRGGARRGFTGFVYFNNDMNTRAPLNAVRLMELVGPSALTPKSSY